MAEVGELADDWRPDDYRRATHAIGWLAIVGVLVGMIWVWLPSPLSASLKVGSTLCAVVVIALGIWLLRAQVFLSRARLELVIAAIPIFVALADVFTGDSAAYSAFYYLWTVPFIALLVGVAEGIRHLIWTSTCLGTALVIHVVPLVGDKRIDGWTALRGWIIAVATMAVLVALARTLNTLLFGVEAARRRTEAQLQHQTTHDPVTGLPNRTLIKDRLVRAIESSAPNPVTLLVVEIDAFKPVIESLGHDVADQLLAGAGRRLRATFPDADTVGRLSGDQFTVVHLSHKDDLDAVRRRFDDVWADPFHVANQILHLTGSVGAATSKGRDNESDVLFSEAEAAVYTAKAQGRGHLVRFDASMEGAGADLELEHDIRETIAKDGVTLHYQPVVDMRSRRIMGVEALLRWECADGTWISPERVIMIAERASLIEPLGHAILERALTDIIAMNRTALQSDLTLSVNVTPHQLLADGFVESVLTLLAQYRFDAKRLAIEITESVVLENLTLARERLAVLRSSGVRILLDDFGSGYSSLNYLRILPVDAIKIDRSFLFGSVDDSAEPFIAAIIGLAKALNIGVIAEGVENASQEQLLLDLGCVTAQGFLYSRPIDSSSLVSASFGAST